LTLLFLYVGHCNQLYSIKPLISGITNIFAQIVAVIIYSIHHVVTIIGYFKINVQVILIFHFGLLC